MPGTLPGMASTTLQGWPAGSTVTVHRVPPAGVTSLGPQIASGVAGSDGRVLLLELEEDVQYVAASGAQRSTFQISPAAPTLETLAARVEELEATVETLGGAGVGATYSFAGGPGVATTADLDALYRTATGHTGDVPAGSILSDENNATILVRFGGTWSGLPASSLVVWSV